MTSTNGGRLRGRRVVCWLAAEKCSWDAPEPAAGKGRVRGWGGDLGCRRAGESKAGGPLGQSWAGGASRVVEEGERQEEAKPKRLLAQRESQVGQSVRVDTARAKHARRVQGAV